MVNRLFRRILQFIRDHELPIALVFICFLFLVVYLSDNIFILVKPGEMGVLYRRFGGGTQTKKVYGEGLQIINPWNKMFIYNVRVQQMEHTFSALTTNGVKIGVTVSIRYRPRPDLLGFLHKQVGPEYAKTIVVPEVHAIIRKSFGRFTAEELYTTKRYFAENTLEWGVNKVGQKYIILDDLLIETITLPRAIETAIYGKETAAIKVQEMNFQVQVAESDAKRRQAEAVGIKNANALISESISEQILRHEGITAALELAKSTNAKIVVVGDKNGLPLFYDPAAPTTPAMVP